MTGNTGMDTLLVLIMIAATIWYIDSTKEDLAKLLNKLKKKHYTLYIYHEGNKKFEKITTYKERNMRNAIVQHFLSYERDISLLRFKPYTDYNDYTMHYVLDIDGDLYIFAMLRESEGVKVE